MAALHRFFANYGELKNKRIGEEPNQLIIPRASLIRMCFCSVGLVMLRTSEKIMDTTCLRGDTWFRSLHKNEDDEFYRLVVMICDAIWHQRNRQIFDQEHADAKEMSAVVVANLRAYIYFVVHGWHDRISPSLLTAALLRPLETNGTIFCDAKIFQGGTGVGVVAFDSNRNFLKAVARRFPDIQDPLLAECLALEKPLLLILDLQLTSLSFVGDAMNVIHIIQGVEDCPVNSKSIIVRIRNLLENDFFKGSY